MLGAVCAGLPRHSPGRSGRRRPGPHHDSGAARPARRDDRGAVLRPVPVAEEQDLLHIAEDDQRVGIDRLRLFRQGKSHHLYCTMIFFGLAP